MKRSSRSPWVLVSLGIVGMVAGYTFQLMRNGGIEAALFCPVEQADTTINDNA